MEKIFISKENFEKIESRSKSAFICKSSPPVLLKTTNCDYSLSCNVKPKSHIIIYVIKIKKITDISSLSETECKIAGFATPHDAEVAIGSLTDDSTDGLMYYIQFNIRAMINE